MIEGANAGVGGVTGLGADLSLQIQFGVQGPQGEAGSNGYSVYLASTEIAFPSEGMNSNLIAKTQLSNGGAGVKVGDLIISENGTLCEVVSVSSSSVQVRPFSNIAGKDGKDGENGTNGEDGVDGKDGTDGIDGIDGKDGTDGYSIYSANTEVTYPSSGIGTTLIAKTQLSNGGAGIKVGDLLIAKNGTLCQVTTVNSANVAIEPISSIAGKDGAAGAAGKDGADGYTPVRGTDYWTDADKAEIKAYVDEAILGGEW